MLKTHFATSQFVVVSLKDGMFNNANVLFKTKFQDGLSTVRRYLQGHHDGEHQAKDDKENGKKGGNPRAGKKARAGADAGPGVFSSQ